jgi:hypothetical protein
VLHGRYVRLLAYVDNRDGVTMSESDHTVIGQALGYVYQFERATYRLLQADNTVLSVAIEHIDDVSIHRSDGTSVREQDKTTIRGVRPLTDQSVALWKTLGIWIEAVLSDPDLLTSTEFHLVTNGEVSANSLAARIHAAKAPSEMVAIAIELLQRATNLRQDLQPLAAIILRISASQLADLVGRTYVFDKVSAQFGGDLEQLQVLHLFGKLQRIAIFDNAMGWVRRTVLAAAEKAEPTVIDRAAFDHEVRALVRRVAVAPLAMVFEPQDSNVDPANYRSHGFFQQLDWIDTDSDFLRNCVIHYVQARAARMKWTDSDDVSEASIIAYEEDLKMRWSLQVRRQSLRTYGSASIQGQERLYDTLSEDTFLDGQPMPKALTCGSFHALADFDSKRDPDIGWHPEFEHMAKAAKGKA